MSFVFNAVLARYERGYVHIDQSGTDLAREMYLELGGVTQRAQALELVLAVLDASAAPRRTVAVEGVVLDVSKIPGVAYRPGDRMGEFMLRSFTLTQVGEGLLQVVPELDDPLLTREQVFQRRLAAATSGVGPEFGRPVIQRQDTGTATDSTPPPFSQDGPVVVALSPPWVCPRPFHVAWFDASLYQSGTTPTQCTYYVSLDGSDGSYEPYGILEIEDGQNRQITFNNRHIPAGATVVVGVDAAGEGAEKLTLTLRGVMV